MSAFSKMAFITACTVFQEHIKLLLEENFKTSTEFALRDPCLYGDFRTALDESEPRLYEDIQDYDAAKALFQEVGGVL